jgi:hypothetical protein
MSGLIRIYWSAIELLTSVEIISQKLLPKYLGEQL